VIEGDERLDSAVEQRVEEPVVVVEAALLAPVAVGKEPRPCEREAVRVDAERRDQLDVVAPAAVAVGRVTDEVAALAGEVVPDRRPAAVGLRRPFDLQCRGGDAPAEAVGKRLHQPSSSAASQP
jgi:hypothetical protein